MGNRIWMGLLALLMAFTDMGTFTEAKTEVVIEMNMEDAQVDFPTAGIELSLYRLSDWTEEPELSNTIVDFRTFVQEARDDCRDQEPCLQVSMRKDQLHLWLEKGTYLLCQSGDIGTIRMEDILLTVPESAEGSEETLWIYPKFSLLKYDNPPTGDIENICFCFFLLLISLLGWTGCVRYYRKNFPTKNSEYRL